MLIVLRYLKLGYFLAEKILMLINFLTNFVKKEEYMKKKRIRKSRMGKSR